MPVPFPPRILARIVKAISVIQISGYFVFSFTVMVYISIALSTTTIKVCIRLRFRIRTSSSTCFILHPRFPENTINRSVQRSPICLFRGPGIVVINQSHSTTSGNFRSRLSQNSFTLRGVHRFVLADRFAQLTLTTTRAVRITLLSFLFCCFLHTFSAHVPAHTHTHTRTQNPM